MDQVRAIPTRELPGVVMPTVSIYAPLINANEQKIKSVPKQTFSYGSNPRHQLDVYIPNDKSNQRKTVLVFFYGGGMVHGDKTLAFPGSNGLVYANLAAYFVLNHGYTVVVPDYRLLGGQHGDVKFPAGGEDVGLAVEWITTNPSHIGAEDAGADIFVLGNSAGGMHAATYLFEERLEHLRAKALSASHNNQPVLKGVALLGVPYALDKIPEAVSEMHETYYGPGLVDARTPLGLFQSTLKRDANKPDFVKAGLNVLVMHSELDPDTLCIEPKQRFVETWKSNLGGDLLEEYTLVGHNHISPPLSLSTGRHEEEVWGERLASWIEKNKS